MGEFANKGVGTRFVLPYAELLRERISAGRFNALSNAEVHVGEQDWRCVPENVRKLGCQLGLLCIIVPGAGQKLGKEYWEGAFDRGVCRL